MIGEALPHHLPKRSLDGQIHLGDQIDRALLVNADVASEPRHHHVARLDDDLDGRRKKERVAYHEAGSQDSTGFSGASANCTRLVILLISIPPTGALCTPTSSTKFRMRKMPRAH